MVQKGILKKLYLKNQQVFINEKIIQTMSILNKIREWYQNLKLKIELDSIFSDGISLDPRILAPTGLITFGTLASCGTTTHIVQEQKEDDGMIELLLKKSKEKYEDSLIYQIAEWVKNDANATRLIQSQLYISGNTVEISLREYRKIFEFENKTYILTYTDVESCNTTFPDEHLCASMFGEVDHTDTLNVKVRDTRIRGMIDTGLDGLWNDQDIYHNIPGAGTRSSHHQQVDNERMNLADEYYFQILKEIQRYREKSKTFRMDKN
jgi:hypothetical protein